MPHATPPLPHRVLSSLSAGTPTSDPFGLTVIPLGLPAVPSRSPPGLAFTEMDPPTPTGLLATNRSAGAVTVSLGDVISGGMVDRVVTASLIIAPGAAAIVPAEALSAGWWPAVRLQTSGRLSASLTALLVLAASEESGLRCIARTALWEARRRPDFEVRTDGEGWLLVGAHAVLAAHLVEPGVPRRPSDPAEIEAPWPTALEEELFGDAGSAVVTVLHHRDELSEAWIVRATTELPDAVLAAALR